MNSRILRLITLAICLVAGGCHRKPPPVNVPPAPSPPPAPTNFDLGESSYNSGHYAEAARFYERYIMENEQAPNRDKALFRLGMSYSLDGSAPQSPRQALLRFRYLVTHFPQSPYRREAEFILGLQASIEKLNAQLKEKDAILNERDISLKAKDAIDKVKDKTIVTREATIKEREATLKEKNATIDRLTQELERMKKIDLERRPPPPPE